MSEARQMKSTVKTRHIGFQVRVNGKLHQLARSNTALQFALEQLDQGASVDIEVQEGLSGWPLEQRVRLKEAFGRFVEERQHPEKSLHWIVQELVDKQDLKNGEEPDWGLISRELAQREWKKACAKARMTTTP